ncbi:apolipoprotein N-acyltransferase [Chitinophaga sp.]|uniref:apolipoprotein N-acyltransferase n=1 Tax=Chitinophaga sp. TaxID=1869181 RepID=UPI0031E10699
MNPSISKRMPLLLSILAGCTMWAAWPTSPLTFLVFAGFVPLLAIADRVQRRGVYFGLIYLALWIWNTGTTWWVGNTTVPASGIFANAFNALLMSIPLLGFKIAKERTSRLTAYFALVVYWLTFEYIHQQWELSWPWLTLGNAFASRPGWVQWYEYTGTPGGSLYVLLANILVYEFIRQCRAGAAWWKKAWLPALFILAPMVISVAVRALSFTKGAGISVVVVQPNIDPYDEKFSFGMSQQQVEKLLRLTRQQLTEQTDYVIWPETALFPQGAWEHELNAQPEIQLIRSFLRQYPNVKLISGASTYKKYTGQDEIPATARTTSDGNLTYDAFNSAIQVDTSTSIQVYHKMKLVPGVEITPYMRYLPFMKKLALDFGGITGSYGLTPGVSQFRDPVSGIQVFDAICYESVYSDLVAQKVREGANFLAVSTNDGWWGNTQGHKQHMEYARLRAIETRRWVVRSANTGISCAIDQWGQVHEKLPYWEEGVFTANVQQEEFLTFYVRFADYIAKAPPVFCILLLLYTIVSRVTRRKYVENNQ